MKHGKLLKCPNCGAELEGALTKQFVQSIRTEIENEFGLQIQEREKTISDLTKKLYDALRIGKQGSMQVQGAVQELHLYNTLKDLYPLDEIAKTKTGQRGADLLQTVRLPNGTTCGKIYYESKNTRSWTDNWLSKFKQDNLPVKADMLVLVSQALPKSIKSYGLIDGVWVCSYDCFSEFTQIIRYAIIRFSVMHEKQKNKDSKMELLYNYFISDDFKNVFESMVDSFKALRTSHDTEKIRTERLWKERELHFDQIIKRSIDFYANLRGIAGNAIPEIKMLEFSQSGD